MPEQHNPHNLDPALRELESALGDIMPAGLNAVGEGSGQRDQLMFAMGQAASGQHTRRVRMGTHVGTAMIALLVGTLITLPWRTDPTSTSPKANNGRFVKSDADIDSEDKTKMPAPKQQVVAVDEKSSGKNETHQWALLKILQGDHKAQPGDELRYASMRELVFEQGVDALPEARTGVAGGSVPVVVHRFGRDSGSF